MLQIGCLLLVAGCATAPSVPMVVRPADMADPESCGKRYFANAPGNGDIILSIEVDRIGELHEIKIVKSGGEAEDHAALRALKLDPSCRVAPARDQEGAAIDSKFSFTFHRQQVPPPSYPGLDAAASAKVKPPDINAAACGRAARYPLMAEPQDIEGWVTLEVRVEPDGRVSRATVRSSSAHHFEGAALEAIRSPGCRFSPAIAEGGRAVATDLVYTFHFGLR
jgi:TonB family protein